MIIARDVIFDEAAEWKWEELTPQPTIEEYPSSSSSQEISDNIEGPSSPRSPSISNTTRPQSPSPASDSTSTSETIRHSKRDRHPPSYLEDFLCNYATTTYALFTSEPQTFQETTQEEKWIEAMNEEIKMIEKNNTWELVNKPPNKEVIGLKWVYKTKYNEDSSIQKYKARLVAKGYSQQPGIDFNEKFAPVVRMETIRTVLALAAQNEAPSLPVGCPIRFY